MVSKTPSFTQPFVEVPDQTAKLIIAMMVDVGLSFSYSRVLGDPLKARLVVTPSRADTLFKIQQIVEARLQRAGRSVGSAPVGKLQAQNEKELPPGHTLHRDDAKGNWFWKADGFNSAISFTTPQAAVDHAWECYL